MVRIQARRGVVRVGGIGGFVERKGRNGGC